MIVYGVMIGGGTFTLLKRVDSESPQNSCIPTEVSTIGILRRSE